MDNLFEKLYEATDDAIKQMKKPLVRRKLKRAIQSAFDNAENEKIAAEETLQKERKNFETYDINSILTAQNKLTKIEKTQAALRAEFKVMFSEDL